MRVRKEYNIIENIIIEIKNPEVKVGKKEYDQIKAYSEIIDSENEFNANNEKWTYILIGNNYDSYIIEQIEAFKDKSESTGLVFKTNKKEIYTKKWSELFNEVELRLDFIAKYLKISKSKLIKKN